MRTLTDVTSHMRQVEVELSTNELAMRLGYTGLNVTHIAMEDGKIRVHLFNDPPKKPVTLQEEYDEWIGQEREVKHRCSDRECCPICNL